MRPAAGHWGLRRRIAVVAGLGLVLAILASTLASRALATAQLREAQQSRAQAIAEGLAVQLQRILALGLRIDEIQGFEAQCREALEAHQGLAYVLVAAPGGALLAGVALEGDATHLAAETQAAVARHGPRPPALAFRPRCWTKPKPPCCAPTPPWAGPRWWWRWACCGWRCRGW